MTLLDLADKYPAGMFWLAVIAMVIGYLAVAEISAAIAKRRRP